MRFEFIIIIIILMKMEAIKRPEGKWIPSSGSASDRNCSQVVINGLSYTIPSTFSSHEQCENTAHKTIINVYNFRAIKSDYVNMNDIIRVGYWPDRPVQPNDPSLLCPKACLSFDLVKLKIFLADLQQYIQCAFELIIIKPKICSP